MSSRSMGVTKVVLSRRTISWVSVSPACSRSLIRSAFALAFGVVERQLLEHTGGRHDVAGLLLEQVEELLLAWKQAEHAVVTSSVPPGEDGLPVHAATMPATEPTLSNGRQDVNAARPGRAAVDSMQARRYDGAVKPSRSVSGRVRIALVARRGRLARQSAPPVLLALVPTHRPRSVARRALPHPRSRASRRVGARRAAADDRLPQRVRRS